MNKYLKLELKVSDLFRLKTIENILNSQSSFTDLVAPYDSTELEGSRTIIFIHPGHGGSEVYQSLVELLPSNLNCVGIDNYNQYSKEKIHSLPQLAKYYLDLFSAKYDLTEPITLLGWSLGGLIALETASILEEYGFKNITVFLLDTVLNQNNLPDNCSRKENLSEKNQRQDFSSVDLALTNSPLSAGLQDTNVILFQAVLNEAKKQSETILNNITNRYTVIPLDCNHWNILSKSATTISRHIQAHLGKKAMPKKNSYAYR